MVWSKLSLFALSAFALGAAALFQPAQPKGTVNLFLSTDCPMAMKYTSRINALHTQFGSDFEFVAYFPNEMETLAAVQTYVKERGYTFTTKLDPAGAKAKSLGVTHVPEFVVTDTAGRVLYQGAFDDAAEDPARVKTPYLSRALEAIASGKTPTIAKTAASGCLLMAGGNAPAKPVVTYADHVANILNTRCLECHRPGEVAPFSLVGYENAKKWSQNILRATEAKRMPPWKAVPGFGEFAGENRLTEAELQTLRDWVDAGAPRGDADKEPTPPKFPEGWRLGEPDLTLKNEKPFNLEADGADVYRNFVFKTNFAEPRYVTAMDVRPGNKKVVHHVIAFVDVSGRAEKLEADTHDGQAGYTTFGGPGFAPDTSFGGWAPGYRANPADPGMGFLLKPGATVVVQVHYHKSGKPEQDQTEIGLYFSKVPVTRVLELAWVAQPFLRIPAGEPAHTARLVYPIRMDATIYGVMPHMHLLGRSMKAEIEFPDGTRQPLIHVDDWDFRWQLGYQLKQPIKVPKGSKIVAEAVFDNSASNPHQPNNPPKDVRWGEDTTDEMFLLVVPFTRG